MWNKKKTIKALGVDDRWFMILGILVVAFLFPLVFLNSGEPYELDIFITKFGIALFYTITYWISIRILCIFFRLRFPSYKDTGKRLFYYFLATTVVFSIVQLICQPIHGLIMKMTNHPMEEKDYVVMPYLMVVLVSTIYESIFLFHRWKESAIESERLRRENVQSQLEGLKNQVNPHFLFNSLNTLAYLIPEDSDKAVCFVQKLSKVYRYILEIRNKKLILLEEELDFLHSYIFLLRERFGNNISIQIAIEDQLKAHHVIPLSLQILFENAIKHNVISKYRKLLIHVHSENGQLIVKNNLQRKTITAPSTKVGLKNIQNRYAYFTDQKVDVIESSGFFIVRLPLIQPTIEQTVASIK